MPDRAAAARLARHVGRFRGAVRRRDPPPGEIAAAGAALLAVLVVDVLLRALGLARTRRLARGLAPLRGRGGPPLNPTSHVPTLAVVRALDRAGRLYRPNGICLHRSLLLWSWLRRHGVPAGIDLGIRKGDDGGLVGHAWVTLAGVPLFEPEGAVLRHAALGDELARWWSR